MADYQFVPDSDLDPGSPLNTSLMSRLARNPEAMFEGAVGAPRLQTGGIDDSAVVNTKVANGTLGAEKFQAGTDERNWVRARIASFGLGHVGSYAFLSAQAASTPGAIRSGSGLRYSDHNGYVGATVSGTWLCLGHANANGNATLFLRVS